MSSIFTTLLITHVFFGVIAAVFSYVFLLHLLKKELKLRTLKIVSLLSFISYYISWLTGGYYYWFYYGTNVKPLIKSGQYPWAHSIVMESKEHIFLLLPVLTFVLTAFMYTCGNRLTTDTEFKSSVTFLASVTLALAVIVTISGFIISGGAR